MIIVVLEVNMNQDSIKHNIASSISYYRRKNHMTQAALAECLSVKPTTVSTWERGVSLPDAETLFKICSVFHLSLSTLCQANSDKFDTSPFYFDQDELDLVKAYRNASESRKESVRTLLNIS